MSFVNYDKMTEGIEARHPFFFTEYLDACDTEGAETLPDGGVEFNGKVFYPLDHPKYAGIATAKGYDQSYSRIAKTKYNHEAMIDVIVANPSVTQNELARTFDRSVPWISRIMGSDAFQAALAKRREEVTDPFLIATIEERMNGLAMQSLDILAEKLHATQNPDLALEALKVTTKALGFGARAPMTNINNNFVIPLPPKMEDPNQWARQHAGRVIEG